MTREQHKDQENEEQTRLEEEDPQKLAADLASMQEELERLQEDTNKTHEHYLRTLADFDNYRRRQRDEMARHTNLVREELIFKLLPILDNFQRTIDAAQTQHSYDTLVEGVSLTLRQIGDLLHREGLEPIEAVGQEFNPEFHEAMMRVVTDEYPENTIIDELEKGYTLNGKVLRPSRVRVAVAE